MFKIHCRLKMERGETFWTVREREKKEYETWLDEQLKEGKCNTSLFWYAMGIEEVKG